MVCTAPLRPSLACAVRQETERTRPLRGQPTPFPQHLGLRPRVRGGVGQDPNGGNRQLHQLPRLGRLLAQALDELECVHGVPKALLVSCELHSCNTRARASCVVAASGLSLASLGGTRRVDALR